MLKLVQEEVEDVGIFEPLPEPQAVPRCWVWLANSRPSRPRNGANANPMTELAAKFVGTEAAIL